MLFIITLFYGSQVGENVNVIINIVHFSLFIDGLTFFVDGTQYGRIGNNEYRNILNHEVIPNKKF